LHLTSALIETTSIDRDTSAMTVAPGARQA
jgi:hypothetical protein